ncbi:MAG: AMP-binding protein, partial [bacterium]|nr:AMP-binding protein [bacterium]
ISGENVMLGYWNSPEEQRSALQNGWLFTGDLGYVDSDGYLYIASRKKDIIKVGGFRVSAREIEECILQEPRVQEVAVVGVPDPVLGEALKAFVAPRTGMAIEEKEIKDHCQINLSARKAPSHVEFLDSLPKLKSGKVDRSKLGK